MKGKLLTGFSLMALPSAFEMYRSVQAGFSLDGTLTTLGIGVWLVGAYIIVKAKKEVN